MLSAEPEKALADGEAVTAVPDVIWGQTPTSRPASSTVVDNQQGEEGHGRHTSSFIVRVKCVLLFRAKRLKGVTHVYVYGPCRAVPIEVGTPDGDDQVGRLVTRHLNHGWPAHMTQHIS